MSSLKTECGIYGIYYFNEIKTNNLSASRGTILGLEKLQHRGQESAGISYIKNNKSIILKNIGLVKDIFKDNIIPTSNICIGHVRYSTSGKSKISKEHQLLECQPLRDIHIKTGIQFSIAYNGNMPNFNKTFLEDNDTFYLKNRIKESTLSIKDTLIKLLNDIPGVYCLLIMINNKIYALRDKYGVRPLCIGRNEYGLCISSESCALDINNFKLVRDIQPGELVCIDECGITTLYILNQKKRLFCIFELIYFLREDSILDNYNVIEVRKIFGRILALEEKKCNDMIIFKNVSNIIVVGSPNTAIPSAKEYANVLKLNYQQVIVKKDKKRTFILPNNEDRIKSCNNKFKIIDDITNKDIILVDDSLVRGNTLKSLIILLRQYNVKSIHIRIASPPVKYPCFFGIDIPTSNELIAYNKSIDRIKKEMNVDSLHYIKLEVFKEYMGDNFCMGCFDGIYNKELLEW